MKKVFILLSLVCLMLNTSAQKEKSSPISPLEINLNPQINFETGKSAGDTLFLFDGYYFLGTGFSLTGLNAFQYTLEDLDQNTLSTRYTNPGTGYPSKASFLINQEAMAPGDTNYFLEAISDFAPPATANDWMSMGPIAIPAGGATLSWKHNYPDVFFRAGYKVYISTVGLGASNFTGSPIFTVADNDASTATDTLVTPFINFYPRTKNIDAYAGQSIYIGFQHIGVDQDKIIFDDILILENSATSVETEISKNGIQVFPNPSNGNFILKTTSKSQKNVEVLNGLGEVVYSDIFSSEIISMDLSGLSAGVYSLVLIETNKTIFIEKLIITQ